MEFPVVTIPPSLDAFIESIRDKNYTINDAEFEELREYVFAKQSLNELFDYSKTSLQNIECMAENFECGKLQRLLYPMRFGRYYPSLAKNDKMTKALKLAGDNFLANEEFAESIRLYSLAFSFRTIKKSDIVQTEECIWPKYESYNIEVSLPKSLKIVDIPGKGKCLIAVEPLAKGSTVFVEEPYVYVTKDQLKWQVDYCDRCLKSLTESIPCQTCVFLKYCSIQCRDEDQMKGHCYECPALPALHAMKIPDSFHLALKIICRSGPQILYDYHQKFRAFAINSSDGGSQPWLISPFLIPEPDRLSSTGRLKFNRETKEERREKLFAAYNAIVIAQLLRSYTTFFAPVPLKTTFQEFLAVVILRHYNVFSDSSSEFRHVRLEPEQGETLDSPVGIGIYPRLNLINRTGVKNVIWQNLGFGKFKVVTTQDIEAGEELCLKETPVVVEEPPPMKPPAPEPHVELTIDDSEVVESCWGHLFCAIL